MKIIDVLQNSPEWLEARKGKITGSKLKDVVTLRGTGRKIGFYELLADRLAAEEDAYDETDLERGNRLEAEAIEVFSKKYKKEVEQVGLCVSERHPHIALSPDGMIKSEGTYTEAVEVKCLSTPRYLEAMFENKIHPDYRFQVLQYFIVNEDLEKLYFVYYDPRVVKRPMHCIEVTREEVADDVETYANYQDDMLHEIERMAMEIMF